MLAIGLFVLALSSNYLITAIVRVAEIIRIPEFIISAIILSLISGVPELTNNFISAFKGVISLGIGNLIGSSIISITVAVGIVHLFSKEKKIKDNSHSRILLFLLVPIALFLLFSMNGVIGRLEGLTLLSAYVGFQYFLIQKGISKSAKSISSRRLILPYLMIPLSVFCVVVGGYLVVDTASTLANLAGLTSSAIGLTFVAFGTAVPEIIQSISSVIRKRSDVTLGTSIGGLSVYLMLIMGLIAVVFTIPIKITDFMIPAILLAVAIIFYFTYTEITKKTDKFLGFTLLLLFLLHLILNLVIQI